MLLADTEHLIWQFQFKNLLSYLFQYNNNVTMSAVALDKLSGGGVGGWDTTSVRGGTEALNV